MGDGDGESIPSTLLKLVRTELKKRRMSAVNEGAEPIPVQMSDLKIEEHDNDEWVTISVGPSAGNRVAFIKYLAADLYFKKYEVKSKTGKPFRFDTFKANGFAVKVEDRKALLTFIMRAINKFNTQIKKDLEHKQKAPERRKAAAIDYAAQRKITQDELKKKYGDAVNLVRTRQIGGDDGYQYNVLVRKDDRWVSIMNGLTQREADYYKNIEMENMAKKNGWGQYAKVDEDFPSEVVENELETLDEAWKVIVRNKDGVAKRFPANRANSAAAEAWRNSSKKPAPKEKTDKKAAKDELDRELHRRVTNAISSSFPDGEPLDRVESFLRLHDLDIKDVDRVMKRFEKNTYTGYLADMWDDFAADSVADAKAELARGQVPQETPFFYVTGTDGNKFTGKEKIVMNGNPWK